MKIGTCIVALAGSDTEALTIITRLGTGRSQRASITGAFHATDRTLILVGRAFLAIPGRGIGSGESVEGRGIHVRIPLAFEGLDGIAALERLAAALDGNLTAVLEVLGYKRLTVSLLLELGGIRTKHHVGSLSVGLLLTMTIS